MGDVDFDVIVVGSGAAGLVAAISAQEQGAQVLVVEATDTVGGASRLSHGHILASETRVQEALGLTDDKESMYLEYMLANRWRIKSTIARRIADTSGPNINWLMDLGIDFLPFVHQDGGEKIPRTHMVDGKGAVGGQRLIEGLQRTCRERGIEIVLGNRVDNLLLDEDGAVRGVSSGGEDLTAHAVVLATGGFGANRALIKEHLPSLGAHDEFVYYIGPESSQGDAIGLAHQVGANLVGHDACKPTLVPRIKATDYDSFLPVWCCVVGSNGHRLIDETAPYGQLYGITELSGGVVYAIFDAETLRLSSTGELPTFTYGGRSATFTPERLEEMVAEGAAFAEDSIESLATKAGIDPQALAGAAERYSSFFTTGFDADFGKDPAFLRPIESAPFYAVPLIASVVGITGYGVEIDGSGQVLSTNSPAIPGLYAAGECTGGVVGTRYLGGGNGLASAIHMGRAAGTSAGVFAARN